MITEGQVIDIMKQTLFLMIEVSAPLLLVSLVVGLIISIFQTATSIQEQTMTFVPKVLAVFFGLMLVGPWMLEKITTYIAQIWNFQFFV